MTRETDRFEERLGRLAGATRAAADPAVLARVRTRLAAEQQVPWAIAWLGTPAGLATACALLVVASFTTAWIASEDTRGTSRETSLVSSLVGDDGSYGLPSSAALRTSEDSDTGRVKP